MTPIWTPEKDRALLGDLGRRRAEIGQAVLARVRSIGDLGQEADPDYLEGLKLAVESAVDHWIEASGRDQDLPLPLPDPLLMQARLAARRRVPMEVVLRRYLAGHAVLGDFLMEEAARLEVPPILLRRVLRTSAAETDRILAAISSAYVGELESSRRSSKGQRRAKLVRRLLDGELIDPAGLDYPFERLHLGIAVRASGGAEVARSLLSLSDVVGMRVDGEDGVLWAWAACRSRPQSDRVRAAIAAAVPTDTTVGIGEPAAGLAGWRLTHDQARAALTVAERTDDPIARYADVAMLASAIRDELLTNSLRKIYLDPLDEDRGDTEVLRETLRAYFVADRSVSSTATALAVTRNTVTNRLRTIESRIGHLSATKSAHLEFALRLDDLDGEKRPI